MWILYGDNNNLLWSNLSHFSLVPGEPKQLDKFGKRVSIIYCIRESTQRRGRFRGDELVTCHPLFSDFTEPNYRLYRAKFCNRAVIPNFGYLNLSENINYRDNFHTCTSLAVIPLLLLSNLVTIFFKNNYR